jgi:hypothetical protein
MNQVPTVVVSEQRLQSAGWVSYMEVAAGRATMFVSSDYPNGYRHTTEDKVKGVYPQSAASVTPEPVHVDSEGKPVIMSNPEPVPRATVDGRPVSELAVLIKPVAFFVTIANGTYELSRCYFQNGKFTFGPDMERIGGISCQRVEFSTSSGLRMFFSQGYEMSIPQSHCQATWRP